MQDRTGAYNLLDESWIPVLMADGRCCRVGIRDALAQAGSIRQIAASNPMDRVAVLRFLLALVYWLRGSPPEGAAPPDDWLPADWREKLEAHRDCFNLLGEGRRFYQCRASQGGKPPAKLTANYLVQEVPTGTNFWHFRHAAEGLDGLCCACCALGLLRLPAFATSGGRGKPPGVNAKPPLYVIPVGSTLAATIFLSWQPAPKLGIPCWVEPQPTLPKTGTVPLLVGLTWIPRRVWLDDPMPPDRKCISCGRTDRLIRSCIFGPIGSTKTEEGGESRQWRDPHVVYQQTSKGPVTLHARDALSARDAAAGQWCDITAAVVRAQRDSALRIGTWVVGFATVQNDKYLEAAETLVPVAATVGDVQRTVEALENWREEDGKIVERLKPPHEKPGRKHVELAAAVAAIQPDVERRVSARTSVLLTGGQAAWEKAAEEYAPFMKVIADAIFPDFTSAALEQRRRVAALRPNMRPQPPSARKPRGKKGGQP